jgi:hypothetical protein
VCDYFVFAENHKVWELRPEAAKGLLQEVCQKMEFKKTRESM